MMIGLKYKWTQQIRPPGLCPALPTHNFRPPIGGERLEQHRRQRFPALTRVRTRCTALDGKNRVQQQHALTRPMIERAVRRWSAAKVAL